MKYSNAAVQQNDAKLVSKTLLRLATPRIIMRTAVITVTIIIWLWLATQILGFGATQDYAFLNKFNAQLVAFLQSINIYLWWVVVVLLTLIVYFFLSAWFTNSVHKASFKTVPADTAANLIQHLSPEGRDVLGWVWRDRSEPINIGNLKTTRDELQNNRVSKLAQIREQERLLGLGPGAAIAADDRLARAALTPLAQPAAQSEPARDVADAPATAKTAPGATATSAVADQDDDIPVVGKPAQTSEAQSGGASLEQTSAPEQTEPTIGGSDSPQGPPAKDEVKHTIS